MSDKLKISKFAEEMVQSISQIHKASQFMLKSNADPFSKGKITFPQYILLDLLYAKGSIRMKDIADSLNTSLPAATGMVDRLLGLKNVIRTSDPRDRRVIFVELTTKGVKVVEDVKSSRKKMIERMFSDFTDSERKTYLKLIRKVKRTLDEKWIK